LANNISASPSAFFAELIQQRMEVANEE